LVCATDFELNSNFRCIRANPTCSSGSYSAPLSDASGYACVKCPLSCATCGFLNTSSINSAFVCNTCNAGYEKQGNQCAPICQENTYLDSTDSTCKACHKSCLLCSGPNTNQCLRCNNKFSRNAATGLCDPETNIVINIDCGVGGYE
jgi:hypothetical protein